MDLYDCYVESDPGHIDFSLKFLYWVQSWNSINQQNQGYFCKKQKTLIAIDKVLISDEIVEEQFVCDLDKCKGGCCEDGEAGAPLEKSELSLLTKYYNTVKPYLTSEGIAAIEKQGTHVYDQEFGWVTPTIKGKMCAYGYKDKKGIIKCGIEQAYNDNKIEWKKPISCHLYPIRVTKTRNNELLNYEPRESLCNPACVLGKKLKVPTYVFLKESLIRKYGEEFYNVLSQVATDYFDRKSKKEPVATANSTTPTWPKDQKPKE